MRLFMKKVFLLLPFFVLLFLTACEKDPVLPQEDLANHQEQMTETETINDKSEVEKQEKTTDEQENEKTIKEDAGQKENSSSITKSEKVQNQQINNPEASTSTSKNNAQNDSKKPTNKVDKTTDAKLTKEAKQPENYVFVAIYGLDKKAILSKTKVPLQTEKTVLDVTLKVLKEKRIPIEFQGKGATAYVQGIGDLYEFDHGPLSGWIVKKNGILIRKSAGVEPVKPNDQIEWIYTTDYTKE